MDQTAYRAVERRLWASLGAEPIDRSIHLARTGVSVRIQELGAGPPVLFVHGANTSGASWAALASRLPGFRCLLLDRPGTGLSQALARPLDAGRVAPFADGLVVDVLDGLGLESAHLVATSLGGYIALRSAAAHPTRIRRMVQFSWPVGAPIARLPWFMRIASVPGVGRLMAAMPVSERSVRLLFRQMGDGPSLDDGRITQADLDCYVALLRHTATMKNEIGPARAFVSLLHGLDRVLLPDSVLAAVVCPTLFVWGGRDPFGGAETARAIVARIPGAELDLLADAGHSPWLDDLTGCADRVAAFLGRPG